MGTTKQALDTPALIVDLDLMERNIARIAETCRQQSVAWRPHIKGQKVPQIAHQMLAAGATGVTCAKLGEAEIVAAASPRQITAGLLVRPHAPLQSSCSPHCRTPEPVQRNNAPSGQLGDVKIDQPHDV